MKTSRRGVRKKSRNLKRTVSTLDASEAKTILAGLVEKDPRLARKVVGLMRSRQRASPHRNEVDLDYVAEEVFNDLSMLDVETIWERSGRKRYGYVDPVDAAWDLMEETMDPHLKHLERLWKGHCLDDATRYCKGMLAGLCKFEMEGPGPLVDWMTDDATNYAEHVLKKWADLCHGKRRVREVAEFAVASLDPEFLQYVYDDAIKEAKTRVKPKGDSSPKIAGERFNRGARQSKLVEAD